LAGEGRTKGGRYTQGEGAHLFGGAWNESRGRGPRVARAGEGLAEQTVQVVGKVVSEWRRFTGARLRSRQDRGMELLCLLPHVEDEATAQRPDIHQGEEGR